MDEEREICINCLGVVGRWKCSLCEGTGYMTTVRELGCTCGRIPYSVHSTLIARDHDPECELRCHGFGLSVHVDDVCCGN